jgi:hypothetical protein
MSRYCSRIDDEPDGFTRRLHGRVGQRLAQVEMVDDDMHGHDPIGARRRTS